ncbi:hypothetical protein [Actinocorallia herbida]|nr:hypothetical protein [Actinocorallia herbida]
MITQQVIRADIGVLLLTGQAMDFATRLKGYNRITNPDLVKNFARLVGLGERQLYKDVLPILKACDVIDFEVDQHGQIKYVEEFVGVTGSVISQTFKVLDSLKPSDSEIALLHSIEIASWAPLTTSQHLQQITNRVSVGDESAARGLKYAFAIGINQRILSKELNEEVVFNPHVWGTRQVEIASFLQNLPPNERDALLGICESVTAKPGSTLDSLGGESKILTGARKVGLIQAATVKSNAYGKNLTQTYAFSPLIQTSDDQASTTEALHLRKLFIAHILFGREKAALGRGRIMDPVVLVGSLLRRGQVGPATNIGTDYHMLEAAGVVRVEGDPGQRAYLKLIKEDIVSDGLDWLKASLGSIQGGSGDLTKLANAPGGFVTPERDRSSIPDDAASEEILTSTILELRKEAQRAVRHQSPFNR